MKGRNNITLRTFIILAIASFGGGFVVHIPKPSSQKKTMSPSVSYCRLRIQQKMAGKGFAKSSQPKRYKPMSKEEMKNWMSHIPIYVVSDANGNGKAIYVGKQDGEKKTVLYFFLSSIMAEAFAQCLPMSPGLAISGLFLGQIWDEFSMLRAKDSPVDATEVEYRLVGDPRDILTAEAAKQYKNSDESFQLRPYNDIPLFSVKSCLEGGDDKEVKALLDKMVSSHFLFFSSQNRMDATDAFFNLEDDDVEDDLLFLGDLFEELLEESTVDYRASILVAGTPIINGTASDKLLMEQLSNEESLLHKRFVSSLLNE